MTYADWLARPESERNAEAATAVMGWHQDTSKDDPNEPMGPAGWYDVRGRYVCNNLSFAPCTDRNATDILLAEVRQHGWKAIQKFGQAVYQENAEVAMLVIGDAGVSQVLDAVCVPADLGCGRSMQGGSVKLGAYGHLHGHLLCFDEDAWQWVYADDLTPFDYHDRPCPRCGAMPTPEGHDGCLGTLPGVIGACCGHGIEEPMVILADGRELRGKDATEFIRGVKEDHEHRRRTLSLESAELRHRYLSMARPRWAFAEDRGGRIDRAVHARTSPR